MTTPEAYDAIVIGAGQAGPSLAVRLANAGLKVALVERKHLGGTCVNDGCIPTKTLVASARAAHVARHASDWGVDVPGPVRVDMKAVKGRKDRVVAQSIEGLDKWLSGTPGLDLVWGHARFTGPHAVEVGERRLEAPRIFLNVGARAVLPAWQGIDSVPVLTNTSMMAIDALPEHLVIAGGSYIGLEFAQMYRRFGARVTVIEYGARLIAREDPEVSSAVQAMLACEGIAFYCNVQSARVSRGQRGGIDISFEAAGSTHEIQGSHLLAAVGRRPNTDDLGLEAAGIATDAKGFVAVDDELRTNVEGVWALGDCNGRGAFTHTSYNDYQIAAADVLEGAQRKVTDRITAYALFTDPPLARVGMNEAEARKAAKKVLAATMPMTRVGRARERGETTGFMKVLVDGDSQRILGASLLCIEADEIVHSLLDVMAAGASYTVVRDAVHIHPTVSELIPTLLEQLKELPAAA